MSAKRREKPLFTVKPAKEMRPGALNQYCHNQEARLAGRVGRSKGGGSSASHCCVIMNGNNALQIPETVFTIVMVILTWATPWGYNNRCNQC